MAGRNWLVMVRDVSETIWISTESVVKLCLVLDTDTGLALGHGVGPTNEEVLSQAFKIATTQTAGSLKPGSPAKIFCSIGLVETIRQVGSKRIGTPEIEEVVPGDEAEDIFDSLVARLSGRSQPKEPAAPENWRQLYSVLRSFMEAAPWERWADDVHLGLELGAHGNNSSYVAIVMGNAGVTHGLVLYPGNEFPKELIGVSDEQAGKIMPAGTTLIILDSPEEVPGDLVAKARRYGWPENATKVPLLGVKDKRGMADLGASEAAAVILAATAILELDKRGLVLESDAIDVTGQVALTGGTGRYTLRVLPNPEDEPEPDDEGVRMYAHEVKHDLVPIGAQVSVGSLPAASIPWLRQQARIHRPAPSRAPKPTGTQIPVVVIHPRKGMGDEIAANTAKHDPIGVVVGPVGGSMSFTLLGERGTQALLDAPVGGPAISMFLARLEASSGFHAVLVADQETARGEGQVYGLFECWLRPPPPPKSTGNASGRKRRSKR